ncbi:hypothetical protein HUU62_01910 [Rhodoferax sp. 4810]|uniref:Uncharacterized protein n=1 Tax=Thiospirillum jenense TaxID=1653858 RepID=A0A839H793_9GAMM|nr:hypothetical protein [Thiospirillum jenense]MBB1073169.1 hypothetical protein [Rhodoferax jenense]MBB1124670.1 hypothetical protein [Thiospirillum jenense]
MPYFVYQIAEPRQLTHLNTTSDYKEARALVRKLRSERPAEVSDDYRLMFAPTEAEAERLLSTPRDERVIGED